MMTRLAPRWPLFATAVALLGTALGAPGLAEAKPIKDNPDDPPLPFPEPVPRDPRLPVRCPFRNDTTSVVVTSGREAGTRYVLPPPTGIITATAVTPSANVGFCGEMLDLQASSRALSASIAQVVLSLSGMEVELTRLRDERASWLRIAAENVVYRRLFEEEAARLREAEDASDRIDELLASCPRGGCSADVQGEIDELRTEVAALQNEANRLREEAVRKRAAYDNAVAKAAELQGRIDATFADLDRRMTSLLEQRRQLDAMYRHYASLEGAVARYVATTSWESNVARLQERNPGYRVTFAETRDARIDIGLLPGVGTDSYLASLPVVLGYRMNGTTLHPADPARRMASFPTSVPVDVQLSLVGACVEAQPDRFDVERAVGGAPIYGLTINYEYLIRQPWPVRVRYNPHVLYTAIKERARGGLVRRPWLDPVLSLPKEASGLEVLGAEAISEAERAAVLALVSDEALFDSLRVFGEPSQDADFPYQPTSGGTLVPTESVALPPAPSVARVSSITGAAQYEPVLARASVVQRRLDRETLEPRITLPERSPRQAALALLPEEVPGAPEPAMALEPSVVARRRPIYEDDVCIEQQLEDPTMSALARRDVELETDSPRQEVILPDGGSVRPAEARVLVNAAALARRSMSRTCGAVSAACDGLAWSVVGTSPRPLPPELETRLRGRYNVWLERRYGPSELTFRPAASVFVPQRR